MCIWFVHETIFFYTTLRHISVHSSAACKNEQLPLRLNCKVVVNAKICKWVISRKKTLCICTVNYFFLLLLQMGQTTGGKKRWLSRQSLWRNGFTGGGLWFNFPFIFGTVSSSNPFFFRGVCHLLHFKASSEWISHVIAFGLSLPHWTDPRPSIFFLWKNEWVLIFSSNIPHFLRAVRAIWEAFIPEAICGGLTFRQFLY